MFSFYGLIIAIAVFIGFSVALCRAPKFDIFRKDIENLFLICAPFAVVGARLYHVLSEFSYYRDNLVEVLYFWQGGWGIYGAIFGGIIGIFLYTRGKSINFWRVLDLLAPSLVLGQAIGRIGNIINGELLPYAIYESILNFSIFLFLTFQLSPFTFHFPTYVILYGTGRFFLEFLRKEPEVVLGLKLNQLISLLFMGFGLYLKAQNSSASWRIKSTS